MTSWSWINDPHERQNLSDKLYSKYRKDERHDDNIAADVELQNFDNIWRCACDKGQTNGIIRLCWLNLGRVSPRVYTFESKYCQHLVQLVLDGVGIKSLEGIPQHCHNLKLLSLASNEMTNIAGIHNLKSLTRLNLLRNSITHLPPQICDLVELEQLDVADNKLVHLPADIGNLVKLKCLNIESNELQNLPLSFKNLRCDTLILNCNNFSVFPASVLGMTRLKQLSMNRNKLGYLPSDIGNFNCLEKLHMSGNFINILPDSIVNVRSLRFLWLDFNKLSSLPPNFHRLTKLRELKLEGNPDLVYPPIETVAMGTAAVMTWSRNRSEMMKTSKVRCIVQSVEEVLHQVNRYKIGGILHESVFNIVGKAYQFPPDAFWNIFIPGLSEIWSKNTSSGGMKSFPFERHEVEQALLEFRDAAGPVVKRVSDAKFRRCSCLQSGRGAVCVPPKLGFMCQRPALLVRAKVAYEENMREKRRLAEESKRISNAVIAAKQESIAFLKSEDGMLMVREKAERRISEMEADAEEEGHKNDCDRKKFRGVSSKQIQSEILSAIISGAKSSISKVKTQVQGERKQKILQFENIVKQEYINDNVAKNTRKVLEDNRKIRWIMKSWMGLSVDDAFRGWLRCVKKTKQMQLQGNRSKLKQLRLSYEESIAKYEQKKLEHRNWAEIWDEFNDVPVWINSLTGASQYDEPTLQDSPLIPKILLDEDTGVFKSDSSSEYSDSERLSSEKHVPHGNEEEFELAATRVLEIRRNQLKSRYFC